LVGIFELVQARFSAEIATVFSGVVVKSEMQLNKGDLGKCRW
jgi:hypothetical protein